MNKQMKPLGKLSDADIDKKLAEAKLELVKLRAQSKMGTPLQKPTLIKQYKRTIARILTIKSSRK